MIDSSVDYKNLPRPTWAEIDIDAILNNINEYKKALGNKVEIIVAAKGNGYGHGIVRIPLSALPLWTAIFSPANIWASTQQALLPPTPLRLFRPALLRALQAPLLQVHILTIVTSLITTMHIR